jgi:hypothetical protein
LVEAFFASGAWPFGSGRADFGLPSDLLFGLPLGLLADFCDLLFLATAMMGS